MRNIIFASCVMLWGCASEIDNKPAATVEDVKTAPAIEKTAPAAPAGEAPTANSGWKQAEGSKIEWVGAKVTGDHSGGFNKFESNIVVENNELQSIDLTIDMASVFSDNEKLTGHLMSADFFEVENFASASFKSTGIEKKDVAGASHLIKGELGMRGVTKAIAFPANISVSEGEVSVNAEFSINRTLWNIVYPGKSDDLIKEDVLIKSGFKFTK